MSNAEELNRSRNVGVFTHHNHGCWFNGEGGREEGEIGREGGEKTQAAGTRTVGEEGRRKIREAH